MLVGNKRAFRNKYQISTVRNIQILHLQEYGESRWRDTDSAFTIYNNATWMRWMTAFFPQWQRRAQKHCYHCVKRQKQMMHFCRIRLLKLIYFIILKAFASLRGNLAECTLLTQMHSCIKSSHRLTPLPVTVALQYTVLRVTSTMYSWCTYSYR